VCTLVCNVHASCSAALTVLSYEHRSFILTNTASMYLGSDWFGCLKRFSRSIIINYYVFPCFLQESNSYSAKDYLKFDCSNYDLHMLKFLWKGFAFCLYEGWLVAIFGHSIFLFKNIQSWNSPSEWAGFH
jgi:hypothetical protein